MVVSTALNNVIRNCPGYVVVIMKYERINISFNDPQPAIVAVLLVFFLNSADFVVYNVGRWQQIASN